MSQSRRMSFVVTTTNVAVGYAIAVGMQILVFPWFGLYPSLSENLTIGAVFTVASLIRGYALRRLFERFRGAHRRRSSKRTTANQYRHTTAKMPWQAGPVIGLCPPEQAVSSMNSNDIAFQPVSFIEMKAGIGTIILLWSKIERELAEQIAILAGGKAGKCPHTIRQKIDRWVALQAAVCEARAEHRPVLEEVQVRLSRTLEIRNQISHGVIAIQADPSGHHGDAKLTTELNGETRVLSYAEMQEAMQTLSNMNSAIISLGFAIQATDPRVAEINYASIRRNDLT